jgi:hypothetical protein
MDKLQPTEATITTQEIANKENLELKLKIKQLQVYIRKLERDLQNKVHLNQD